MASPAHVLEHAADALALLLVIQQDSPLVYPVRRDSGIADLGDFVGRKVGVWPGGEDLEFRWMLKRAGVDPESVKRLPMADTVSPFVAGETDSAQITLYNELRHIEDRGLTGDDLRLFVPSDYGVALIKDGLVCSRARAHDRPDFVQAVVNTVLAGWARAFTNPEEAVEISAASWPGLPREEQRKQFEDIRRLTFVGATLYKGLGYPDAAHVARAAQALADLGCPTDHAVAKSIVDTRFWDSAPNDFKIRS